MTVDVLSLFNSYGIGYSRRIGNELEMTCPVCGKENHGYFNIINKVFYCQKCKYGCGLAYFLVVSLNIDIDSAKKIVYGKKDSSLSGLRKRVAGLLMEKNSDNFFKENLFFINPLPKNLQIVSDKHFPVVLKERNVSLEIANKYNISFCNISGKYSNRLIFPTTTLRNKTFTAVTALSRKNVVLIKAAFEARGQKFRKALFPDGSFMGEVLYLYDEMKKASGDLFIAEGVWDVLRLIKEGLRAVGAFGNKISLRQAELLSETNASRIILMFDGDVPRKNLLKDAILLSKLCYDKEILVCLLPFKNDPDNISKKGLFQAIDRVIPSDLFRLKYKLDIDF